jgi:hypothetical protein
VKENSHLRQEVRREALTMALYVSLSLLAVIIALAVVPLLIAGPNGATVSILLLSGFVMLVGYQTSRMADSSKIRSFAYIAVIFLAVCTVLILKSFIGH